MCEHGATRLVDDATGPAAPTLTDAATLLQLASHPDVFAREAFALLADARCARTMVLFVVRSGRPLQVLAYTGWSYGRALEAARTSEPRLRLGLGESRDGKFYLIVEPRDDLDARLTVVALRKIVASGLALERFRQQEQQRAALWPFEAEADSEDGVYVAAETTEILVTARKIATTDLPALITGETGTGKELLARAIHRHSPRAGRIFLPFNCKAVPREMLDSQLFGYRRGAFTGAQEHFPGVIRAAAGGTLFLDEIGELDPDVQPKLLRFLEGGEIHPLGEPHPITVDVRVIVATNARIDDLVNDGRFREDLFYRLNVIRFRLPPLRERREEIPPLIQRFLRQYGESAGKRDLQIAEETLEYLLLYSWPGNVRQLANEIRRLVALAEPGAVLRPGDLSLELRASRRTIPAAAAPAIAESLQTPHITLRLDQPLSIAVEEVERAMIAHALRSASGHVVPAARMLGLSRKGLFLKRRRLGFNKPTAA